MDPAGVGVGVVKPGRAGCTQMTMMTSGSHLAPVVHMSVCIGLDVHLKSSVYKVKDKSGTLLESGAIPTTREEFTKIGKKYPGATVVMEACGVSEWIYDHFAEIGLNPVLSHPVNIRRLMGKKNDDIDSGFLVDAYQLGCLPLSWVPPKRIRDLRQLSRRCMFFTDERIRCKNRVHAVLRRKGIKVINESTGDKASDIFAKKHHKFLIDVGDPDISTMLDCLDFIDEKRKWIEKEILLKVTQNDDMRILSTIPGFGPLVTLGVYSEIGDINRFKSAESLGAYFGLVPRESQSGETHFRGHITHTGSPMVRWLLTQAAWVHITVCPRSSITKKYMRLSKRIGKRRAIIAACRMLLKVCFHLMREKREFRPEGEPRPLLA